MANKRTFNRILITGISGSAGSYLAEHIVNDHPEVEVHGINRWHSASSSNLNAIRDRVEVHEADLMDFGSVLTVLDKVRPDAIFHLAAHANVRVSYATPSAVLTNNIIGTSNFLEAVRLAKLDPIIKLCSTSEVYGQVDPQHVPITEDTPLRPASPYAVSKAAQDLLGYTYFVSYNMRIIRTRMFGYLNSRRVDLFATSFTKQVAWIERGLQKELIHGNLDSVRTLTDVRDAVRAYWEAALYCRPGEVYNIGSTASMKVGDFLERLLGLTDVAIPTRCDASLLRPADVTLHIPCVDKFVNETGWQPRFNFEESLADLLAYWRSEANREVERRENGAQ